MRSNLLAIVLVLTVTAACSARDWYVDNVAGDDRKNGSQPNSSSQIDGPVQTIAKALRHASRIDRIILANTGEPYRESISLVGRHSGIEKAPFEIIGNGAVLDGQR